jgi:hypothetical protein
MPKFDFYPSFNAGEVSPFIDARTTLEKYRSACRTLENFQILPYGGVVRRPGFRFVGETKRSNTRCRLVGFNFSTTTRFVLEMGVGYIRFWRGIEGGGEQILALTGFPLEVVTPYDEGALRELQFAQINDIMYFAHARYPVYKLSRLADNNWTFEEVDWYYPPLREINIEDTTIFANGTSGTVTLTASAAIFRQGHVGSQWRIEWPRTITSSNIEMNISAAHNVSNTIDVKGAWDLTTYGTWDATIQILRIPSDTWKLGPIVCAVTRSSTTATVTHTAHGFATNDRVHFSGSAAPFNTTTAVQITVVDANTYTYTVANSGSSSSTVRVENISQMEIVREYDSNADRNIITSGNELERCGIKLYVKAWTSQTNARVTLTVANQTVGGQVKIATVASNGLSATATVQEWLGTDAQSNRRTKLWYEAAFSGFRGFPRSVALHEQRLCFGGNTSEPNTIWCSKLDDFENYEMGTTAEAAISFTLAASEGNRINWLYSQADLLVGTSGDEWTIGSADTAQSLSSTNVQARRQSSYGSKYMRAALVNDVLLFVQRNGRKVRELVYELNKDGWIAPDLTLLAEHITKGEIVEIAYQQQPDAILWCVRGDGVLIGMTYERDQKVVGWHRHLTDGTIESVAVIYGIGTEDEIWVAVNRVVDGAVKRFIERFQLQWRDRLDNEDTDGWRYLDNYVNNPPNEFAVQSVTLLGGSKLEIILDEDDFTLELAAGDLITFRDVGGTTQLNASFRLKADPADPSQWILTDPVTGADIDTTGWGAYTSGGVAAFEAAYPIQSITLSGSTLTLILDDVLFDTELANGTQIRFESVGGMTQLNGTWTVQATSDPEYFELVDPATGLAVDATSWGTYTSGGYAVLARAYAVPNLSGREVTLYDSGGTWTTQTATRGRVNRLTQPLAVGLPYTSTLRPMKLDMELQDGTSQGRKKRVHQILARTYKSRGGEIRTNGGDWYTLDRDNITTGDQKIVLAGAFGIDADLDVRQTEPYPLALLALEPKWDTYGNE